MSAARYRLLSAAGTAFEDGAADVEVNDGALVLSPAGGDPLRVPFAQMTAVAEAEPFTIRVTLADQTVIELSRLGAMRTQLLAELADGRGDDAAAAAGAVGQAEIFSAVAGDNPAELRVYDDALLITGAGTSERVSFSFVTAVQAQGYTVTVEVAGAHPVAVSRLGRRTGEFADLLTTRLREARGRTSAFLASLLPGLEPMALRRAAGLLRDGVAAPASDLNGIHPGLVAALTEVAVLPARRETSAELARRTDLAIGFKQLTSVRRAAVGTTPWRDPAAAPHIGEHESPGGYFRPGLRGMLAGGIMTEGVPPGGFGYGGQGSGWGGEPGWSGGGPGGMPFGYGEGYDGYGAYWAFRALGAGMNAAGQRPMTARADVSRGRLTPATEDLAALTAAGQDPTVLAFALGRAGDRVVFEALNRADPETYVYRAAGPQGLAAINRALDEAGFRPAAVHAQGLGDPARRPGRAPLLTRSLAGQIPHGARWPEQLAALLAGT